MKATPIVRILLIFMLFSQCAERSSAREFRNISTSSGLSDLVVNEIYKDSKGYIWFGTGLGIDRFDGTRIVSIQVPGDNAKSKRVNAIGEAGGRIYAGNGTGLFLVDETAGEVTPALNDRISFGVNSMLTSGDRLYIGTDRGFFIYDSAADTLGHILPHNDVMSRGNVITSVASDGEDGLWLTSSDGLLHYRTGCLERYPLGPGQKCLLSDVKTLGGQVFVGTSDCGLLEFDREHGVFDTMPIPARTVTSLSTDTIGNLYVGTDGEGVYIYNPELDKIEHFIYERGQSAGTLSSNSVYSILAEGDGRLWVGFYQAGADYTPGTRDIFSVYRRDGLDTYGMTVRSLAIDGPERLIGTREGLYFYDEKTGRTASFRTPRLRGNMIFAVRKVGSVYYVGVYNGGMYVFDPATLQISDFDSSDPTFRNGTVFDITCDAQGACFIATSNGVYRYENGRRTAHYTDANSHLPSGNVYEIFFDSLGRGWFCTESGLCIYDNGTLRAEGFPKGFVNREKIREVYEDSDHNLYFVPDKGQIFISNTALTKFGPVDDHRLNTTATFVVEDRDKNLWISTNYGLLRYDPENNSRLYNNSDGLPSPVFTLCKPVIDENGSIWFGNTQGLVCYNPDIQPGKTSSVRISGIYSDGDFVPVHEEDGTDVATLRNRNSVSLTFSDPDFTAPENHSYEYRLDGVDSDWRLLIGKSSVTYYRLEPGNYRFHVRKPGVAGSEVSAMLEVSRPASVLSIILIVGLFIAIAAAVFFMTRMLLARRRDGIPQYPKGPSEFSEKYRTSKLSEKECRALYHRLNDMMQQKRLFTDPDLKIADLAIALGTTSHAMSYFFNQFMMKSYSQYINELRVEEFKRMVRSGDISRLTLAAISERCGFSSRASFFRHFKNMTGITPNEYIQNYKK